jgi:phosphoribosylamine-glycine ligase
LPTYPEVGAWSRYLEWALAKAYEALGMIHFDGIYFRHDIGYRAVKVAE